jgi:hypothetical protein
VLIAMKEHDQCASLDQICETVNRLTKREMPRIYIGQILATTDGCWYDHDADLWHFDTEATAEAEEDTEDEEVVTPN